MNSAMHSQAPVDQVTQLIKQVADENGLEVEAQLDAARMGSLNLPSQQEATASTKDDELDRRFVVLCSSDICTVYYLCGRVFYLI